MGEHEKHEEQIARARQQRALALRQRRRAGRKPTSRKLRRSRAIPTSGVELRRRLFALQQKSKDLAERSVDLRAHSNETIERHKRKHIAHAIQFVHSKKRKR